MATHTTVPGELGDTTTTLFFHYTRIYAHMHTHTEPCYPKEAANNFWLGPQDQGKGRTGK